MSAQDAGRERVRDATGTRPKTLPGDAPARTLPAR